MKANELRSGSVISIKGETVIVDHIKCHEDSVTIKNGFAIVFNDGDLETDGNDNIKPIALSPEILLKCGFYQGEFKSGGYYGYSNGVLELDNDFNICLYDGRMDESETKIFVPETEYLHQLQNLYFALTGEELEVKL